MSLSRAISGLWEPMSPITVTRDDMQEIRAEASRCLLVHQIRICDVKQSPPWTGEGKNPRLPYLSTLTRLVAEIVEVAAQLLSWLVARPDRKIIRLIHIFAEDLNMKPMDTVNYALSVWRASSAHFSEDAHYIGDQKIPVIGTNAILLATLDWRPGPAVRPWLKESLLIANVASAALAAALMILRHRRYGESTPFGELELVNAQSDNSEGTQMFLQSTLDTIRRSQIDQGINVGQELGLVLGVNIQLSKDLCLWALQSDEERFAPASLLHPARRTLGSPWRKFCLCYGMGNEFIVNAIPPCLAMLEFRLPGVLERMYSKKRSEYMWMRIKHRQVRLSFA